jgi:transposase-like protein
MPSASKQPMISLTEVYQHFPTTEDCLRLLARSRWPRGIVCYYCQQTTCLWRHKFSHYYCAQCQQSFTPTVATIFYRSHLPLQKWFWLILHLRTHSTPSIRQLSYRLNINKSTAHKLLQCLTDYRQNINTQCYHYTLLTQLQNKLIQSLNIYPNQH